MKNNRGVANYLLDNYNKQVVLFELIRYWIGT